MPTSSTPAGYQDLREQLEQRVRASQLRTAADAEALRLHRDGRGTEVVTRLAGDLRAAFPGQRAFPPANPHHVRAFAAAPPPPTPPRPAPHGRA